MEEPTLAGATTIKIYWPDKLFKSGHTYLAPFTSLGSGKLRPG